MNRRDIIKSIAAAPLLVAIARPKQLEASTEDVTHAASAPATIKSCSVNRETGQMTFFLSDGSEVNVGLSSLFD